ncbi:hypothetical protein V8E51_002173 [Hyaloscypha variabilis]|uniref:Uncharacterized protein n=1 Tax=Hyaloscypha variabilis (strain UAMH 11265 / GT02V1 / F) TaxID=1149755 RepID=A0A2J6RAN4_HYAVF|nr:hypothetical protein L207DRAFT_637924 [Hyaloscypha variabilis F]
MNRARYEPVPQREEVIILDSIQSPYYNYNSAVPNSVSSASSVHTPSLIAPSVPSSPPPSFHTHSSPGTPRPIPSNHTGRSSGPSYAELWGVAPSTAGETEMTMGTSNDALATIAGLKQRIEWLEESVGRLLLEKEQASEDKKSARDNCCVFFTDASPDMERALTQSAGTNCCVTFRSSKLDAHREQRKIRKIVTFTFLVVMLLFGVIFISLNPNVKRLKAGDTVAEATGLKYD